LKEQWCLPPEASGAFVCQMEQVLDVYELPEDPEVPLVCMDESNKQLVKETRTPLPMEPGQPARYDNEYERNGVRNLFLFFEPLRGKRWVKVTEQRTQQDWATCIKELVDVRHPTARKIRLVLDNLNTHTGASLYETFPPEEAHRLLSKLELIYTPKHGSWLNMAEIELSVLGQQCLSRRIPDAETLEREVAAWEEKRNAAGAAISWRFTTADARIKLKHLYPSIQP
jgi:hypothetical protein